MLFYAFAFWWGGWLMEGNWGPALTFDDLMRSLWALGFMAAGMGGVASFAGDARKAEEAKQRIFKQIDLVPAIDARPFEEDGTPRKVPTVSGPHGAVGRKKVTCAMKDDEGVI